VVRRIAATCIVATPTRLTLDGFRRNANALRQILCVLARTI
jgi:hypothetical protein